jgi:small subunit ribosomal protein S9
MNTDSKLFSYGIGRRKQAVAQVILKLGSGKITINKRTENNYLQNNLSYIQKIHTPLLAIGIENTYDLSVKANGGGLTGQTEAITLGIAHALIKLNIKNQPILKAAGLLTCDARIKERKKYGLKKARKASQFSKR